MGNIQLQILYIYPMVNFTTTEVTLAKVFLCCDAYQSQILCTLLSTYAYASRILEINEIGAYKRGA